MNFNEQLKRMEKRSVGARNEGIPALRRLVEIAKRDTGQSRRVAELLLGLYNGNRFRFNLNDLRGLDTEIFEDCISVLRMDSTPKKEVHEYFDDPYLFDDLAVAHGLSSSQQGPDLT